MLQENSDMNELEESSLRNYLGTIITANDVSVVSENEPSANKDKFNINNSNKIKIANLNEFKIGDDWKTFQESLEKLFTDFAVTDDERKISILLTLLGQEAFKILKNLCNPESPLHQKYDDLCKILKIKFEPEKPIYKERKEFYELTQNNLESVSDWYTRIMEKASLCKFGANTEQQIIKDKFVTGLIPGPVSSSLIQNDISMNLTMLFNIAKKLEKNFFNKAQVQPSTSKSEANLIPPMNRNENTEPLVVNNVVDKTISNRDNKKNDNCKGRRTPNKEQQRTNEPPKPCRFCGGTKHYYNNCRFRNDYKSEKRGVNHVCPHLHTLVNIPKNLKLPDVCLKCNTVYENFICLHCHKVYCEGFVNKHVSEHTKLSKHPLILDLNKSDLIFCYECKSYIENPGLDCISKAINDLKKEKI